MVMATGPAQGACRRRGASRTVSRARRNRGRDPVQSGRRASVSPSSGASRRGRTRQPTAHRLLRPRDIGARDLAEPAPEPHPPGTKPLVEGDRHERSDPNRHRRSEGPRAPVRRALAAALMLSLVAFSTSASGRAAELLPHERRRRACRSGARVIRTEVPITRASSNMPRSVADSMRARLHRAPPGDARCIRVL